MREIKFRVFKKETGIMYYPESTQEEFNHYFQIGSGGFWLYDREGKLLCTSDWGDVLMQFTGLKDKNGNDIYEGDLLRYSALSEWEKINYAAYEVFFHDGDAAGLHIGFVMNRAHYHGSVCGGYIPGFKPSIVTNMEVIGNVYEFVNPAVKDSVINTMTNDPNIKQDQESAEQAAATADGQTTEQATESAEEGTTEG